MRKNKTYIFCLMLIACTVCRAQRLDIKPYFLYHQSVSREDEPVFYNDNVGISLSYPNIRQNREYLPSPLLKDFTLATGIEYGLVIDYTSRNHLGFELGLGYFKSLNNGIMLDFYPHNPYQVDWNYHSFAVRPLFSYAVIIGKSAFIGKIGPSIHYASATRNVFYMDEKKSTCTFTNGLNWGYSTGLEYNYQLLKQLSLVMELGFEQYKYTPDKATIEYEERFVPEGKKKIDEVIYVNKIVQESMSSSDYFSFQYKKLKESTLLNNVYIGIGIKYNLWGK